MSPFVILGLAWLILAGVMLALWVYQRQTGQASWVDVVWTIGVACSAIAVCAGTTSGLPLRRFVIGVLIGFWAVRLAAHLANRIRTMPEDGRYQHAIDAHGDRAQRWLFGFFQSQAVVAVLFAVPLAVAAQNSNPWQTWDYVGCFVWLAALAGETLADRQLQRFRADPHQRGQVCRSGLWSYSRHPNYFFEWLHWWAYVGFAVGAPFGWWTLLGPLTLLYLIVFVTGIPPTEAQSLRSRGDAYREYQRTTSAFFPWFPRRP